MFTYVFVTLSFLQSQFIETGFKKADNSEQNVELLLFLFTLNKNKERKKVGHSFGYSTVHTYTHTHTHIHTHTHHIHTRTHACTPHTSPHIPFTVWTWGAVKDVG